MTAWDLRTLADRTGDPELYEMAAADFEKMDMPHAAQHCRDKAAHYRSDSMPVAIPELAEVV